MIDQWIDLGTSCSDKPTCMKMLHCLEHRSEFHFSALTMMKKPPALCLRVYYMLKFFQGSIIPSFIKQTRWHNQIYDVACSVSNPHLSRACGSRWRIWRRSRLVTFPLFGTCQLGKQTSRQSIMIPWLEASFGDDSLAKDESYSCHCEVAIVWWEEM